VPAAPTDRGSARDRLLDAAERCLESCGVVGTTMEDIGRTAGVSRATVYRYFPSREAVMSGVIIRAAERYLDRISPRIAAARPWAPRSSTSWNTRLRCAAKRSSDCCSAATKTRAGVGRGGTSTSLLNRHRISASHLHQTLELRGTGRLRRRRRRVGCPHDTEPADCSRAAGAQSGADSGRFCRGFLLPAIWRVTTLDRCDIYGVVSRRQMR
jgi:AcrR family transcriptional regulator